jgi:general nucleoside transport system permease protein
MSKTSSSASTQTEMYRRLWRQVQLHLLTPSFLSVLAAIALALLIGAGLIAALGFNPLKAYAALLDGAVGNRNSTGETLLIATPLALAGVGVSIAFQAGAFNVGGEGQLFLGAIASTFVGLKLAYLPGIWLIPLMILTALVVGALWAGIAGLLKIWCNSNEMINTIMMNYIAIFFVSYLVHGPLQDPHSPLGQTSAIPDQALLPVILHGTRLHAGLFLAILVALIVWLLLRRTTWGFHIRVVGKNPVAAQAAGIQVNWILLSSLLASGALAGLAGYVQAAGVQHRMIENISPGYGYTAIVVALLGQLNPLGVLVAAVLFGGLQVGATTMESAIGVPSSVVTVIQYSIVLFLIGRGAFAWARQRLQARVKVEQSL